MAAPDDPSGDAAAQDAAVDSRFDIGTAHIARVYNYWLGGYFLYTHNKELRGLLFAG